MSILIGLTLCLWSVTVVPVFVITQLVANTTTPFNGTSTPESMTTSNMSTFTSTPESMTTSNMSTFTPTANSTTVSTPTTTTATSGQILCPNSTNEISYIRNETSCSDYFMCYGGTPIPMTCPVDLEFNSMTGSCAFAQSANCKTESTTVSPRVMCTNTTSGYFHYPSNCHYYYRCTKGMLIVQECPVGFGWDSGKKMCTQNGCSAQKS